MIFPLLLISAGTLTANEVTVCDEKWKDTSHVDLGCLLFEKSVKSN